MTRSPPPRLEEILRRKPARLSVGFVVTPNGATDSTHPVLSVRQRNDWILASLVDLSRHAWVVQHLILRSLGILPQLSSR